jgi:enoyl-CoA hydratase/carnithine racemase
MSFETVLVSHADGVATITLNRPERMNAWNAQLAGELSRALDEADAEDAVRAIVITGAGRAFCAGADLDAGGDTFDDQANAARAERAQDRQPLRLPYELRKPVIAAINGHAIGVGITYPLLADVRIVAADAKISFAFVRRGVLPELASHAILPRVVGFSNAADLLLSGRMITGSEAAARGLASAALPAEEVLPAAVAWARDVAVNAAPVSVATAKRLLWQNLHADIEATTRRELPLFAWLGRQPDAKEGVTAFIEKRPPNWTMSAGRDLPEWPD